MGVLGASIVSAPIPNSEIKTHSKDERASKQRENPVSNYGKVFLIPLLILIFTVTGISLYVYNRQKQLRNPS